MKIATWNVNSIRARQQLVLDWVQTAAPDVVCLQETKVVDDDFPREEFARLGYEVAITGQKSYNGVAIASRYPLADVTVGLDPDPAPVERRAIAATIGGIRVVNVYVPNGKALDSPSFPHKLQWLGRLKQTLEKRASPKDPVVVCGDFNIAPEARDVYDPERLAGRLHFSEDEHRALADLMEFGLRDALRLHRPEAGLYSWWDYRAGAYRRDLGLRIDLILVTPPLAKACRSVEIDKSPRSKPKPSDHTPVIADFDWPSGSGAH